MAPAVVLDQPRALRPVDIAESYRISERLAGDWLRTMVAGNVAAKSSLQSVPKAGAL